MQQNDGKIQVLRGKTKVSFWNGCKDGGGDIQSCKLTIIHRKMSSSMHASALWKFLLLLWYMSCTIVDMQDILWTIYYTAIGLSSNDICKNDVFVKLFLIASTYEWKLGND